MSFNLLDAVKGYLGNDLISSAASYLGESESTVKKGFDAATPLSLLGIAQKAESGNAESVLNLARQAYDSGILGNFSNIFSSAGGGIPSIGPGLISGIFGDKFGAIANAMSTHTGLKGSTSASMFGTILPLALALLGKHANDNNVAPGALASLLGTQKNTLLSSLPSGFDVASLLGVKAPIKQAAHAAASVVEEKKTNWLMPLLLGLLALGLLWYFMRSCNKPTEVATVATDTVTVVNTKVDTLVINKEPIKLKLSNGVELDAYKGGIEDLLIAFLNDPNATVGKDNWFDFNDLNFKFGTAEIVPESQKQISNIVEILKAYPKVKIKLGGYTDKVGDEAANKKISGERATAVATALKAAGVGAQVSGAEGYGSAFAKYPADAPETDRLKDRRVSVSVREK